MNYFDKVRDIIRKCSIIQRKCPICEVKLQFRDYVYANSDVNTQEIALIEELIEHWKDSRIAILCCKCKDIIKLITDPKWKYDVREYAELVELFFYRYSKNSISVISKKMQEKLILFGILKE